MKLEFNIKRIVGYGRIRLYERWRKTIIGILSYFGLGLIVLLLVAYRSELEDVNDSVNNVHTLLFLVLFVVGGVLTISNSFIELIDVKKTYSGGMLPVSNFEKVVFEIVYSSLFWAVISVSFYLLFSVIINFIFSVLWDIPFEFFDRLSYFSLVSDGVPYVLINLIYYHSIFFFGAAVFKDWAWAKTILSMLIIYGVLFGVYWVLWGLIFPKNAMGSGSYAIQLLNDDANFANHLLDYYKWIMIAIGGLVIPGALYTGAYFKLKQKQL